VTLAAQSQERQVVVTHSVVVVTLSVVLVTPSNCLTACKVQTARGLTQVVFHHMDHMVVLVAQITWAGRT
jgi:hypothetical protein